MESILSQAFLEQTLRELFRFSFETAPLWLPVSLGMIFFKLWNEYKRSAYLEKQHYILLEIKVPKDVEKSPLAMEVVLSALYLTFGESTWFDRIFLGKIRAEFSLEIVSLEGNIHFFIRTREGFRGIIESQIYSQYPTAEIYEVPDYTPAVPYRKEGSDWNLFGVEFKLKKPDPYPIKTYIDYELDKDQFEVKKVDPLTAMLEFMGSVGKGEQVWFQILVRANKGKGDPTTPWRERDWQSESKKLILEIIEKAKERAGPAPEGLDESEPDRRFSPLTEGERNAIKAIERNVSKLGFDCGIRMLYVARKNAFNGRNISGLFGALRQYNTNDLNGFANLRYTQVDYPWQEYIDFGQKPISLGGNRVAWLKWALFDSYRRRSWFFSPYERKPFVLNTEELATIFHFPGRVAETPTFPRIESKKSEPPPNLPV